MSEVPNICPICGGKQTSERMQGVYWTPDGLIPICTGHPEPATKHDGKLDDRNACHVDYIDVVGKRGVCIENDLDWMEDCIRLNPTQALSLLAWLTQERDELQRLAKEEEG